MAEPTLAEMRGAVEWAQTVARRMATTPDGPAAVKAAALRAVLRLLESEPEEKSGG